jgi:two-component system CheB/CheR fusion protein
MMSQSRRDGLQRPGLKKDRQFKSTVTVMPGPMKHLKRKQDKTPAPGRTGKKQLPKTKPPNRLAEKGPEMASSAEPRTERGSLPPLPSFMIAGIGASAGGLEACSQVLESLPEDLGMALIIVQHLSPQHESFLPDLLGAHSKLPVVQVTEGMRVDSNRVYVIPPNVHMQILDGTLHLTARPEDRTQHMPIDSFFRSLAEYAQIRSIGVILSGTASDGAVGVREIKAAGGITIVQEPSTAHADGMPRAAMATGAVDLVLAPRDIAAELVRIASHPLVRETPRGEDAGGVDEQFPRIFSMLRSATGVDFTHYKQPTIKRRLQRRMVLHKLTSLDEYIRFLQQNPAEVRGLYQDILIHVTRFFRDPESFEVLAKKAFALICQKRGAETPIRIWVPGCATGEETYSIAIAIQEFLGEQAAGTPIQVFGTDVSEAAIDHARAGAYPESITADVSAERLRRFFTRTDGGYRINKTTRDLCIFARQDITRDPPFSKLDLIVCRNVLIYLGANLQKRLMGIFHYALRNTGFLLLGSAETVGSGADYFNIVDKRHKLYAKKITTDSADVGFSMGEYVRARAASAKPLSSESRPTTIQSEANHIILSRYSPAGVVVDEDLQIVQFRGQTGRFLEPPAGEPSLSLLKMAREGLPYGLRTAIHEAKKLGEAVRREGLTVRTNGGNALVAVEVVPLRGIPGDPHFLILFEEETKQGHDSQHSAAKPGAPARKGEKAAKPAKQSSRIRELEKELAASREYLQSIIQDLEAANEELQSANEEILSANEELQSTNEELDTAKEELQSTNEELNTVNEELQSRNEELSRVNSDLINLLANVQIAIVIVTNDLRIRRFTPMAERVLNLIPTDVGRPISDIKPNIDCANLEAQISEAIDTMSIKESNCRDRGGKLYSLRIRPYKNVENRIDGAVIALFEIQSRGDGDGGAST